MVNDNLTLNQKILKEVEQITDKDDADRADSDKNCEQSGLHCFFEHNKGRKAQCGDCHHKGQDCAEPGALV